MAVRSDFEHEDIHVYAFGRHDHPLESEGKWAGTNDKIKHQNMQRKDCAVPK
jgi:hypothetical protein